MSFDHRRLESAVRKRPPELLDKIRIAGLVKHIHELGAAVGAHFDECRHTFIARLLIGNGDVTETDQRAVIQHSRQLIVVPAATGITDARQMGIAGVPFGIAAADGRKNGGALDSVFHGGDRFQPREQESKQDQEKQQQEQQKQDEKDKKEQEQQQNQDKEKESKEKDKKDENQEQPNPSEGPEKPEPGSGDQQKQPAGGEENDKKPLQGQMSMENALQVLDALKESEKELQDLRKPPVKPGNPRVDKDW